MQRRDRQIALATALGGGYTETAQTAQTAETAETAETDETVAHTQQTAAAR
jgi:hypothetical protein